MHAVGAPAVTVAEDITGQLDQLATILRREEQWPAVRGVIEGGQRADARAIGPLPRQSVGIMAVSVAIDWLWRGARVVYALHPDMIAELADSTAAVLPGAVFRHLPHTNPLVTFAQPIPITLNTGQAGELCGFYVYGTTRPSGDPSRQVCSTTSQAMRNLGLMFVTAVLDTHGRRVDWDLLRVTVPLTEQFTVADAIASTLSEFAVDFMVASNTTPARVARTLREDLLPVALNVLLYLCTDDADTQPVPPPRRKPARGKAKQRRDKPTRVIKVGWRLGPALRAARRAAHHTSAPAARAGTGREQPPHQRRGHFRNQPYGPGRRHYRIRWIKPYMVRTDLLADQPLEHRVIPVGKAAP